MIKILIDSASDLEKEEADALGVALIPMTIRFDSEEFYDGYDLTHREFFKKLQLCGELPVTSQINEYHWEEEFEKLTKDGCEVLAITISSELSGTFACAQKASEKFDGKVKLVGKAIGSKKGNNLLMQLVDKCGGIDFDMPYTLAYSGLSDDNLQKYLKDSAKLWEGKTENIPSHMIGSTIGTHIGAGAIAVAFFAK